jgi:hypothetical protein
MYSLEYTNIPKVFLMPYDIQHCCTLCHSCTNVIKDQLHVFRQWPAFSLLHVFQQWEPRVSITAQQWPPVMQVANPYGRKKCNTDMGRTMKCPSLTLVCARACLWRTPTKYVNLNISDKQGWTTEVWFPAGLKDFPLSYHAQTGPTSLVFTGYQTLLLQMVKHLHLHIPIHPHSVVLSKYQRQLLLLLLSFKYGKGMSKCTHGGTIKKAHSKMHDASLLSRNMKV